MIKVNEFFYLFWTRNFLIDIENMLSVFLSSYRTEHSWKFGSISRSPKLSLVYNCFLFLKWQGKPVRQNWVFGDKFVCFYVSMLKEIRNCGVASMGSITRSFGFINWVDNVNCIGHRIEIRSLGGGWFTLSTQLIKPKYLVSMFHCYWLVPAKWRNLQVFKSWTIDHTNIIAKRQKDIVKYVLKNFLKSF